MAISCTAYGERRGSRSGANLPTRSDHGPQECASQRGWTYVLLIATHSINYRATPCACGWPCGVHSSPDEQVSRAHGLPWLQISQLCLPQDVADTYVDHRALPSRTSSTQGGSPIRPQRGQLPTAAQSGSSTPSA
eukprot:8450998-Pyramimonas_sp.AAC.1